MTIEERLDRLEAAVHDLILWNDIQTYEGTTTFGGDAQWRSEAATRLKKLVSTLSEEHKEAGA